MCTPVPVYCVRGVEERDDLLLLSFSLSVWHALHGREGYTKFWDVPREPFRVGPGPRCESEVTAPPDLKLRDFSHPQPVDTKVFPSSASIAQQLSDWEIFNMLMNLLKAFSACQPQPTSGAFLYDMLDSTWVRQRKSVNSTDCCSVDLSVIQRS